MYKLKLYELYTVAVLLMGLQFMKSDLNIVHSPETQSLISQGLLTITGFTIIPSPQFQSK